jgi:hypothetical protein
MRAASWNTRARSWLVVGLPTSSTRVPVLMPRADSAEAAGALLWLRWKEGERRPAKAHWRTRQGQCGPFLENTAPTAVDVVGLDTLSGLHNHDAMTSGGTAIDIGNWLRGLGRQLCEKHSVAGFDAEQQSTVRARFQARAWFAHYCGMLALVGKWVHNPCVAVAATFYFAIIAGNCSAELYAILNLGFWAGGCGGEVAARRQATTRCQLNSAPAARKILLPRLHLPVIH